ncbi:MAG: NAD-dependent epimerase [Methanobacteriota archaeon]|nr:MAG: NAD-dependent epimerase [Euryarchaeota archaeon]|tara:strand:+ start:12 stop:965 length:954 start_codon:yes stop_codon:yes gene_type:complete
MGDPLQRRILVTGALGQIGIELLEALSEKFGYENIIASDIRSFDHLEINVQKYVELDVLDIEKLERVIVENEINEIYHLAAILSANGEKNPQLCWKINVNGLLNVLELAKKYKFRVFSPSSIAVFGPDAGKLALQKSPLNPSTLYGITKVTGELMAEYYHTIHGVDIRGIRYPGLISWKVLPGGGTTDYAVNIFHKAVNHEEYDCFVNEDTRLPMMYIDDAIRATLELMDAPREKLSISGGYNLPSLSFTAKELYDEIKKFIPSFKCNFIPDRRQEFADSWPDETEGKYSTEEWGYELEYDLGSLCEKMINSLMKRY